MVDPSYVNDPGHWRQRAQEARAIADQLRDLSSAQAQEARAPTRRGATHDGPGLVTSTV